MFGCTRGARRGLQARSGFGLEVKCLAGIRHALLACRIAGVYEVDEMAREYVWLECTETGARNYRVPKELRGTERLQLMKYCPKLRRHTLHKESRKK